MKHIEVYSANNCIWCERAKALLKSKGLDYEEINISVNTHRALEMVSRSGRRTVPQIFIDYESIGGFDELSNMNLSDRLESR